MNCASDRSGIAVYTMDDFGPLAGKTLVRKIALEVHQPVLCADQIIETHIYRVVGRRDGDEKMLDMYICEWDGFVLPTLGPGRDEYLEITRPYDESELAEFLRKLEVLIDEYGVTIENGDCAESPISVSRGSAWREL